MDLKVLREKCIEHTKKCIHEKITLDQTIVQLVGSLEDIDLTLNKFLKRLRDWFSLYAPELMERVEGETLLKIVKSKPESEMGKKPTNEEWDSIQFLVKHCEELISLQNNQLAQLEKLMQELQPNVTAIAGSLIGGRLLRQAGSSKSLAGMPGSTIQVLGAEKALFRHMRSGAKPPKYGILFSHPYVAEAKEKGKKARTLADKIAIASRVDYFKGEFIGEELKNKL